MWYTNGVAIVWLASTIRLKEKMFTTIRRETTLTEQAKGQIEKLILDGMLRPGDQIPPERELGKMLGVSRTAIREAVRGLAAQGLLEVRTGSGTYVRGISPDIMRPPLDLLLRAGTLKPDDIREVRTLLEVRIAELAALRATAEDLDAMEETIRRLQDPSITPHEYAAADVEFHSRLAAATQNPLFFALINSLSSVMIEVRLRAASVLGDIPRERAVLFHSEILDRVKERNPEGARIAMRKHLEYAQYVMQLIESRTRDRALGRNENTGQRGEDDTK